MSESKIELRIGEITFSGEGDSVWLSEQLDKILNRAGELLSVSLNSSEVQSSEAGNTSHQEADLSGHNEISSKPLATWLRDKNAETNQNLKFLATAVWLEAKGQNRLQTSDVTSALSKSNQKKLGNAAECLNQNTKKGYCEKEGKQFYVTEEGKRSLGIN